MNKNDWKPIEEAPRDGTQVLLCGNGMDDRPLMCIAHWGCPKHAFRSDTRECSCQKEWMGEMGARYGIPFTHYIPLPEAPDFDKE